MALDKNDGIFLPSIEGVVSGKTSQVDGMNGIMNNLIGNDNYLKDKKLDRGNYVGSGELLRKDDNGIWGGEYGGNIQDPIPKELNKRYIDNINGKAFICIKAGDSSVTSNTIEYFTPCNAVDNLDKIQNLVKSEYISTDPSGYGKREFAIPSHIEVAKIISITAVLYLKDKGYRNTISLMCFEKAENVGIVGEDISKLTMYRIPFYPNEKKFEITNGYATDWLIQTVFISYHK